MRPFGRFRRVELPLALPGIIAGLRVASISTISLISLGGLLGRGGLGRMLDDGFHRRIDTELRAAFVAVVVLALAIDAAILLVGRLLTPWTRVTRASRAVSRAPS